ncbi:MAG: NlpC/P60 family protein [Chloroflexota bacterium]|nr:NlpC/P60 family protein [Chloroflexota bacterium]
MTTTSAVSVGVADVRRDPNPAAELVTQALMNRLARSDSTSGEWTHVILSDYTGWMRSLELEEPAPSASHEADEQAAAPLQTVAVVTARHSLLYSAAQGDDNLGKVYLSTALPVLNTTSSTRSLVALPGGRTAWLARETIALRPFNDPYARQPVSVITAYARAFLNVPYLWGGTSDEGIDCSGFVQLCYRMGDYILPRDGDQQHDTLECSVKREEMREGDLVFFGSQQITHVAMALNDHEYIHAEGQNYNHVVINSFRAHDPHYYPRLDEIVWGIKRVII